MALRADAEPLALFCADAALAASLNGPVPAPLLADVLFLRRASGVGPRPRPGEAGWGKHVALVYARAALVALDLAQDLSRRAGGLMDAAPKLRAKGKGRALEALLADDAISAAAPMPDLSDRARRRLFERLVILSRRARADRPPNLPALRALTVMARKTRPDPDFDRELADPPPELRWREWKARVEAVLFAAAKPITREVLVRVVGRECACASAFWLMTWCARS